MSPGICGIEYLEKQRKGYCKFAGVNYQAEVHLFMCGTINTFKELQEQIAKKEDSIDVKEIKEVKNVNIK